MALFKHLLDVSVRIQNNFVGCHQSQHLQQGSNLPCRTCANSIENNHHTIVLSNVVTDISIAYPTLLINLSVISHRFVNIVKKKKGLMRLDVSSIAISLLSFWNSNNDVNNIDELLMLSTCIFSFYDTTNLLRIEFSNVPISREDKMKTLRHLINIKVPFNPTVSSAIFNMLLTEKFLSGICIGLVVQRIYNIHDILANLFDNGTKDPSFELMLSERIKFLICLTSHNCNALLSIRNDYQYSVVCNTCCHDFHIDQNSKEIILPIRSTDTTASSDQYVEQILKLLESHQLRVRLNIVQCLPAICYKHSHVLCSTDQLKWTNIFHDDQLISKFEFLEIIPQLLDAIHNSKLDKTIKDRTIQQCLEKLLIATTRSLESDDKAKQSAVVALIGKFASSKTTSERTLLMCFRKTLFYLVNPKSLVAANATLCAETICQCNGIMPRDLYTWYKEQILSVIVRLAVSVYLEYGILLDKTLANFNEMLGYTNLRRDLMKNDFAIITAMVLPYALKYPTCRELLESICALTNLHLDLLFARSFIQIYVYLNLRESKEVTDNCLKFITEKTGRSVSYFLTQDPKRTLSEVLLSYHKKPEFATQTIRMLMTKEDITANNDVSIYKITDYLATRFLGVLNSFGTILMTTNFEKSFQRDALRSLGEMIRFCANFITQYRFKVLELLNSVGTLGVDDLTDICVSVWKIFIHTVDISKLGPLLSTVLVSLEPLLKSHADEVNAILKYLIISNGSLINRFISDLFFLEMTQVSDEIKMFVADHSQKLLVDDTFVKNLKLYSKQIDHENVANVGVRIYGLCYLSDLFVQHRNELNDLILEQQQIAPIIENLLENLMEGSKHVDEKLQIASATCLGNLGAIEPSLLKRNYAPESYFSLSIHTDTFSIMALGQLLRAYQSQKNTHVVNAFALAIQEIFVTRGVDPKRKKKLDIWNSIPEKMKPLMEPFLTSCYTAFNTNVKTNIHPIFGSSDCSSLQYWAFHWSLNMMSMITDEPTKTLLTSFKAAMKNHTGILLMFLPYVLVHSLQCANDDDINRIKEELQCVFDAVLTPSGNDTTDNLRLKCAKTATNQLDFLGRWICHSQMQMCPEQMTIIYAFYISRPFSNRNYWPE